MRYQRPPGVCAFHFITKTYGFLFYLAFNFSLGDMGLSAYGRPTGDRPPLVARARLRFLQPAQEQVTVLRRTPAAFW